MYLFQSWHGPLKLYLSKYYKDFSHDLLYHRQQKIGLTKASLPQMQVYTNNLIKVQEGVACATRPKYI